MVVEWWSTVPFAVLLTAIAVLPLIPTTAAWWHSNLVKLAVSLTCAAPVAVGFLSGGHGSEIAHSLVEYGQFIALLVVLFIVSGGVFLDGDVAPTPRNNTLLLVVGGLAASFVGTTGAAMLLVRPLLAINRRRAHKVHTVVFMIFVVANCGGLLTPLGDPPLFLGFLRGVPFDWTFQLWPQWIFVNALLVLTYIGLERRMQRLEQDGGEALAPTATRPLRVVGVGQLGLLVLVIASVALLPSVDLAATGSGRTDPWHYVPWRELAFAVIGYVSFVLGRRRAHAFNRFTWAPILEVAAVFIGIFIAMVPASILLRQIAPSLPLGRVTFFLLSGGLSSVLDNAPTYATFFEVASQLPGEPRIGSGPGVPEAYLVAISLGAVFCGALTYIGNGPNFMVKAVADSSGVAMPSFGSYVGWAARFLVPVLGAMVLVFLVEGRAATSAGWFVAALIVGHSLWRVGRSRQRAPDHRTADDLGTVRSTSEARRHGEGR